MIGYYVHHVGRGHLHRALAVSEQIVGLLGEPVTILSSLDPPDHLPPTTSWIRLARDDDEPPHADVTAGGRLHWVPLGHDGLAVRMQQISGFLANACPRLVVVDVSVEVSALVRLHGGPVVGVVLPGARHDPAHRLGFDLAEALVAMWPPEKTDRMLPGQPPEILAKVRAVGALARTEMSRTGPVGSRVLVILGAGGHDLDPRAVERAVAQTPGWEWTILDGHRDRWCDDPAPLLREASVVITHAGQNAVAEVAAARRPALVLPQARPYAEQWTTGAVLAAGPWPVEVASAFPEDGWSERLERIAALDGGVWAGWCDGEAGERFVHVLSGVGCVEGERR